MAEQTPAEKIEQWGAVADQFAESFLNAILKSNVGDTLMTGYSEGVGKLLGLAYTLIAPVGLGLAQGMANAEDTLGPAFSEFAAAGVNDVFGTSISGAAFSRPNGRDGRNDAGAQLGRALMAQMAGTNGQIQPSDEAAAKWVNAMSQVAIEDWFKGWFFEVLSSLIPQVDIGKIESYGALGDKVANVLGLSRVSRRVLSPLVDVTIVTPFEWKLNKNYRPKLLTAGEVARQVARGRWTREQGIEELARQGYSNDRIEALFNSVAKFHSVGDADLLMRAGAWTRADALQHLQDQGYDAAGAERELLVEKAKRIASFERSMANEAVTAYANRVIERSDLDGLTRGATIDEQERAQLIELAETKRAMRTKTLSPGEAKACVKAGILSVRDYRLALERDGYDTDAVIALELLLRHELDEQKSVEELRERQAQERAEEKARKEAAAAEKRAQIERERALSRRGSIGDLERAAVRGLITLDRLEEVLAADYDSDTVAILLELVEIDRLAYLAQQKKRDDAVQRAARRSISVADVEAAVLSGVLTIDEYRRRLEGLGFDGADVELLASTLAVRLEELAAARAKRNDAARRTAARGIDLGRFEQLVRRGRRNLANYDALLAEMGYDAGARAGMVELLELQIADDANARRQREEAEARLRVKGLSLDQFRRGVLLGARSPADYERFLIDQGFTVDAQAVLMAALRDDLQNAEDARRRREIADTEVGSPRTPLSTVRRAAVLGVVSPGAYRIRLHEAGYPELDIELELELLLQEIADTQAARRKRESVERELAPRRLSLGDLERAVKLGVRSTEDYRARVIELGYDAAAVDTLMYVLFEELAQMESARRRREQIARETSTRELSLGQLEAAVKAGLRSLEQFIGDVQAMGYGLYDAELLAALVLVELEEADAKAAGTA